MADDHKIIEVGNLMGLFTQKAHTMGDRHGVKLGDSWLLSAEDIEDVLSKIPGVNLSGSYIDGYKDGYHAASKDFHKILDDLNRQVNFAEWQHEILRIQSKDDIKPEVK